MSSFIAYVHLEFKGRTGTNLLQERAAALGQTVHVLVLDQELEGGEVGQRVGQAAQLKVLILRRVELKVVQLKGLNLGRGLGVRVGK